jgi:profilin
MSRARARRRIMSWQTYVDQNLVGTGTVTAAGIYDLAGNPWAYSAGFAVCPAPPPSPQGGVARPGSRGAHPHPRPALHLPQAQVAEVKAVADAMASDATSLAGTGVMCAGVKHMFVRGSADEVYGKKARRAPHRPPPS